MKKKRNEAFKERVVSKEGVCRAESCVVSGLRVACDIVHLFVEESALEEDIGEGCLAVTASQRQGDVLLIVP